ncbi:MAG: discoidin domain-containing protein [Oscillospiraceae bacterium]|nr:discoidin domain-containing protein [Oscillospiraceae bacterium]
MSAVLLGTAALGPLDPVPSAAASVERNFAFRRMAYHSTIPANNYTDVGHNITDGIISTVAPADVATAEDQYNNSPDGEGPIMAVDGDTSSKWLTFIPAGQTSAWLKVTPPPEAGTVVSYTITSANDAQDRDPRSWRVEGSDDGTNWTTLDTQANQSFPNRFQTRSYPLSLPVKYAYYRLFVTAHNGDTQRRLQLSEFDLRGADGKTVLRGDKPIYYNSMWSSKTNTDEWVYVDFGVSRTINRVVLHWLDRNYATAYDIEISDDAEFWGLAVSNNNGAGGTETVQLPPGGATGRYLRLYCKASSGGRFSLSELEAWGVGEPLDTDRGADSLPAGAVNMPLTNSWKLQRASEVSVSSGAAGNGASLSKAFDDSGWLQATVPGTVLISYTRAGAVPDMNVADNHLQLSEGFFTADFWYRSEFQVPAAYQGRRVWLNFNSINWKADIWLNGTLLGDIRGAFIRGRFDATSYLNFDGDNYLAVLIHKNDTPGKVDVKTRNSAGSNGGVLGDDAPTIHASVGWDWVPTIPGRCIGIYGDVFLSATDDVQIIDPWVVVQFAEVDGKKDYTRSHLSIRAILDNPSDKAVTVTVKGGVHNPSGTTEVERPFESDPITLAAGERREIELKQIAINNPYLWWPNNYGAQPLYKLKLDIFPAGDQRSSDSKTINFGIREFTYQTSSPMRIFCNGVRITCTGGNWGMDDANLTCTADDYDVKVRLHAEANFTMIRNWVGMTNGQGFYDACDKYGILIWDDFWLANPGDHGGNPRPKDINMFMENARDKVLRNRYHAALALYCARNEGDPPADYAPILVQITRDLDGTRHYIPHSASGTVSGFGPYGVQDPRWYYGNTPATLHSERGMPNVPNYESMLEMLTPKYAWPTTVTNLMGNSIWGLHDFCRTSAMQADNYEAKMKKYANYDSLKEFTRIAQMVNFENHRAMFEAVYTRSSGRGNGMLMWMSQSAWPSTVWQTYDYYYDTNAGYFGIKHGCQPINAAFTYSSAIFLQNATGTARTGLTTVLTIFNLEGKEIYKAQSTDNINADSVIVALSLPNVLSLAGATDICFVRTEVFDGTGRIADGFYWHNFRSDQYQNTAAMNDLPEESLKTSYSRLADKNGNPYYAVALTNESDTPVLLARVKITDADTGERMLPVYYSDNYVSLMPGESTIIYAEIDRRYSSGTPAFAVDGWNAAEEDITDNTTPPPPPPPPFLPGDANLNDVLDIGDARLVLQHLVDKTKLEGLAYQAADVDRDGKLTITDARLILQKLVGKIDSFEPYWVPDPVW